MNFASTKGAEFLIISDVHLSSMKDERGQALLNLVAKLTSAPPKRLVLLGDIFDFCFGKSPYFQRKFEQLGKQLAILSSHGCQVFFFEGNHEFDIAEMGWSGVEFVSSESEKTFSLNDGKKIVIAHGDLVYYEAVYLRFRTLVRSKFVRTIASMMPARLLDWYALNHARHSRSRDPYRILNHQKLLSEACQWCVRFGADIGIFGHFHVPYFETKRAHQKIVYLLSLSSWDHPNFLLLTENQFSRGMYDVQKKEWILIPAQQTNYA